MKTTTTTYAAAAAAILATGANAALLASGFVMTGSELKWTALLAA